MQCEKGKHSTIYHSNHFVWVSKYRFKVLYDDIRLRVRELNHDSGSNQARRGGQQRVTARSDSPAQAPIGK